VEFFAQSDVHVSADDLQQNLSISQLLNVCESITAILEDQGNHGIVYCLWGEFVVNRERVHGGVRFSLPTCPNNLAWSITTDEDSSTQKLVIHLTVSKQQLDDDFKESIETFIDDLAEGFNKFFHK